MPVLECWSYFYEAVHEDPCHTGKAMLNKVLRTRSDLYNSLSQHLADLQNQLAQRKQNGSAPNGTSLASVPAATPAPAVAPAAPASLAPVPALSAAAAGWGFFFPSFFSVCFPSPFWSGPMMTLLLLKATCECGYSLQ